MFSKRGVLQLGAPGGAITQLSRRVKSFNHPPAAIFYASLHSYAQGVPLEPQGKVCFGEQGNP